ncbi:MAG: DUF2357 domain-containing protein [Smithellaceae bacterium]|nr:DUF2357 domain-containing protein [Smithellaceae bacterium]
MQRCFSRPWELISILEASAGDVGSVSYKAARYVVSDGVPEARQAATGEGIEGRELEWLDRRFMLYEMPGPAVDGDSARFEKIVLSEQDDRVVGVLNLLYPPKMQDGHEACCDAMLNLAYFIRRDVLCADKVRPPVRCWGAVFKAMNDHSDDDPARQALIVDIALELPRYMDPIILHPKRALQRVRDLERIQRVREIDKACLIDMARRPGTGIAEKAGAKQRILAVRRQETRNTLENRVVVHCCELVHRAAKRYLSDHEHVSDRKSKRKRAVNRVSRTAKDWRRSELLQGVKPLSVPCKQPNYVLLQNPHYSRVWNFYRQLVKNEEIRTKMWRWPRRLWSDVAAAALAGQVLEWIREQNFPLNIAVVEERVAGGLHEFSQGRFLCDDIMPGPYILGRSEQNFGTLYIVDTAGLQKLFPDEHRLELLNMDYCLVWVWPGGRRLLPVYCFFADEDEPEATFLTEGSDAAKHLLKVNRDVVGVMLVRPAMGDGVVRHSLVPERAFGVWDLSVSLRPGELISRDVFSSLSPLSWLMRVN